MDYQDLGRPHWLEVHGAQSTGTRCKNAEGMAWHDKKEEDTRISVFFTECLNDCADVG